MVPFGIAAGPCARGGRMCEVAKPTMAPKARTRTGQPRCTDTAIYPVSPLRCAANAAKGGATWASGWVKSIV